MMSVEESGRVIRAHPELSYRQLSDLTGLSYHVVKARRIRLLGPLSRTTMCRVDDEARMRAWAGEFGGVRA